MREAMLLIAAGARVDITDGYGTNRARSNRRFAPPLTRFIYRIHEENRPLYS
jgi:hypothetical protein